jgi:hypothetical protein
MSPSLLLTVGAINAITSGAVLTLVFPLVFVFVVLGIWWVSLRRADHD